VDVGLERNEWKVITLVVTFDRFKDDSGLQPIFLNIKDSMKQQSLAGL